MNFTSQRSKRLLAAVAVLGAAASAVAVSGGAPVSALPPGAPAEGALDMIPASGDSSTSYSFNYEDGVTSQFCSGDADAGWSWSGFIVEKGTDPATVTFPGGLPTHPAGGFAGPLAKDDGGFAVGLPPGLTDGFVDVGGLSLWFGATYYGADNPDWPGAGEYEIGVACFRTDTGESTEYWSTTMTITAQTGAGVNNFTYAEGVAPVAPAGVTASGVDGEATVSWTEDPNDDSYDVTVSGGDLATPIVVNNATSPEVVPGLTNGQTYDVTVTANKAGFPSATSAPVSFTVTANPQPPVTDLTATPVPGGDIDVSWTAPTGETATRDGYIVSFDDGAASSGSVNLPATATSTTLTGLVVGSSYVVTVVATYPAPDAGTPASVAVTSQPDAVVEQEITVERPEGALLFTQRCGVNDQLNGIAAGTVPGFWNGLAGIPKSTDQVGTAPIDLNTGAGDTNFGEYPYPIDEATDTPNPNYTTQCALDLGRAELVTQQNDPFRGTFFRANGQIDQITVADTRDTDAGWTLAGEMSAFSDGAGETFPGDYLGWVPEVNFVSAADPLSGYQMDPAAGAGIGPATPDGLADGATLASAPGGAGLGISELDARLLLLIPLSADAGSYTGTMTFTLT